VTTGLQIRTALFLSLHASIVSIHGHPQLHFETQQHLNFDSDAHPDPQQWLKLSNFFGLVHLPDLTEGPDP
jgi:hypothetical protein